MRRSRANGTNLRALGISPKQLQRAREAGMSPEAHHALQLASRARGKVSGEVRRNGVPRWLRFEVLKRDRFTCRYCGAKAPDVVIQVDHVLAKALGGPTEAHNLVAACEDCNGGKDKRSLSESLL